MIRSQHILCQLGPVACVRSFSVARKYHEFQCRLVFLTGTKLTLTIAKEQCLKGGMRASISQSPLTVQITT